MSAAVRTSDMKTSDNLRSEANRARRLADGVGSMKIAEGLRRLAEQLELEAADAERNETIASSRVIQGDA